MIDMLSLGTIKTVVDNLVIRINNIPKGVLWKANVISILNTPPVTPLAGSRYIVGPIPTGAFIGHVDDIATYSTEWTFETPLDTWGVFMYDTTEIYIFTPDTWVVFGDLGRITEVLHETELARDTMLNDIGFVVVSTDLLGLDTIGAVANNEANVSAVGVNIANVIAVDGNELNINAVNANKINIDAVNANKVNIDIVALDKVNIDAVVANKVNIDAVNANKANIDIVALDKVNIDAVGINIANVISVDNNEININAVNANKINIDIVALNKTNIDLLAPRANDISILAPIRADITTVAGDSVEITALGARTIKIDALYAEIDQIGLKANLASPTFTGTPLAPTAISGTNTTQIATTGFVSGAVSDLISSSPATLDTLNELATALGDDPNFATTVATNIGLKADKTITISAGSGLIGGGDLNANRIISHADTSTQVSVNNSGRTYIQDITLDDYGHITTITSATDADAYVGTVKSIGMTVPTGLSITGSPITTSGTLAIGLTTGYSIPTTISQGHWDTAYTNTHVSGSDNQTISSGSGMNFTGGSGNVTITMGTPTTSTASTTNAVTASSHTHAVTGFLTGNQTITLSGDVSGSGTTSIAVTIANDSHTHDTRYYTETESDSRYVNVTGDTMTGDLTISGALYATSKSFRIPHPTKDGKKLTYASLEGPENAVYVRGRTKNEVISLPDYWWNLVDTDTVTVQLTPIGFKQNLVVKEVNKLFIEINNKKLFSKGIDCYYVITAERKDIPKLKVEE